MKNSFLVVGLAALALVACKKTETVEVSTDDTTVVVTDSVNADLDTTISVIDSTASAAADAVVDAANDAAKGAAKAADKVEEAVK